MGIIGPGSGLGVSAVVPQGEPLFAIAGEGGHVTMAAADDEESAVLGLMRQRYDHVSAERVLSGPGLVNLYNALCELAGKPAAGADCGADLRSAHGGRRRMRQEGDRHVLRHARHRRR